MQNKVKALKEKLANSKIPFEETIPNDPELNTKILFKIEAAREQHECLISYSEELLDQALDCEFEKFRFIKTYEGIWSKDKKVIEVEIISVLYTGRRLLYKVHQIINKTEEFDAEIINVNMPSLNDLEVSIGHSSKEFIFLSKSRERAFIGRDSKRITLKISNSTVHTHDSARDLVEKIANSLFFQIDLAFELPLNLQRQRDSWTESRNKRLRKRMFVDESVTVSEPKYEYDSEPISLYWYAKESLNMPIFQYLAFYQTIEFYFPIYSSYVAKQKVQSLIKDPRFNPNRDADISRIISTIKVSSGGKSFGNEREQLKSTISSCIDNQELLNFFKIDKERFNFYADDKGKNISKQKISVKSEKSDFISEVSERIYEIRCRIVHSKASEDDFNALLPYSSEIKKLNFDIELIEFISRKVLITSSRPIKI